MENNFMERGILWYITYNFMVDIENYFSDHLESSMYIHV